MTPPLDLETLRRAVRDGRSFEYLLFYGHTPKQPGTEPKEVSVGLYGRAKRGQDADALRIVHVEDARTGEP